MHNGEHLGSAAAAQPKKILILGESHHGDGPEDVGKPGKKPTYEVVRDYLSSGDTIEDRLKFFNKISLSFGVDVKNEEKKKLFWDKVCFGNYVDVVCGVGDNTAKQKIKENRLEYNRQLAEFVNTNQIDTIFCFSILVYWALPTPGGRRPGIVADGQGVRLNQKTVGRKNNRNIYLRGYICEPITEPFDHSVTVYGVPHPSARGGFDPNHFVEYLKPVFEDCCG